MISKKFLTEELSAVFRPDRCESTIARHLPFARGDIWEGNHVDFRTAGLVGAIREPASVRGEGGTLLHMDRVGDQRNGVTITSAGTAKIFR